ncbi:hypothetical protein PIB30_032327 [Stylosanthes scabra]|uniref:DUF7642 domain-containing protein n=1 Tax=Stylosanthes scabra TaxID=79078 RepID=A0ABU6RCA3_9FABA|nr:hypothetical protein [Stylosanthes scabra]
MGTIDEVIEVDGLEASLLESEEEVLYAASFEESADKLVKYNTVQWVLYSLLLILAWGIGLLMLLYLPVTRPVPFPCFGVLKKEKHVLLQSVANVVVEQGYLQSQFGVYSLRIENIGIRIPPSDDVKIQGVANPHAFRKAVMMRLSNMRNEMFSTQVSTLDVPHMMMSPSKSLRHDSAFGEQLLLQKLEEVGNSVKRIQTLFEEQQAHNAAESID